MVPVLMYLCHNDYMSSVIDPRAVAIQPKREAGIRRYETVLAGADKLLREVGLSGFSIPVLAERLGYTRRSIYKFFPTPYAILNQLTHQYLDQIEMMLTERNADLEGLSWEEAMHVLVHAGAAFHNERPVARMLILGGAVTDESFRATEFSVRKLGKIATDILQSRGIYLPKQPDVASLAVDMAMTTFRVSQVFNGKVTEEYAEEGIKAMHAYLKLYIESPSR